MSYSLGRLLEVTWDGEFPSHDRFYGHDPFGNRLEFLEHRSA